MMREDTNPYKQPREDQNKKQRVGAPIYHELFMSDEERELAQEMLNAVKEAQLTEAVVEFKCPSRSVAKRFTRILGKASGRTKCSWTGTEVKYHGKGTMRFTWGGEK